MNFPEKITNNSYTRFFLIVGIIILSGSVFIPGLDGPFIFDDFQNLVQNRFLKINSLDLNSIVSAALSSDSGPLKRPIAMFSFALNNYFSGNNLSPYPFKLTNLVIHIANGLLVFILVRLLLSCKLASNNKKDTHEDLINDKNIAWFAAAVAVLWTSHPIQITSVLYVVQRMTSLSATFSLLAIISYLWGRKQYIQCKRFSFLFLVFTPFLFFLLSIFTKETGVLIPLYLLAIELTVFGNSPKQYLKKISDIRIRYAISIFLFSLLAIFAIYVISYASNGYTNRSFNMTERLLTESRVISLYIYLIALPVIGNFAIYHDYINISTSLFSPWTTVFSVLFLIALLSSSVMLRKNFAILSFGIAWFLIGHSLESSFFSLEIAHEHRNYLPSLGLLLSLVYIIFFLSHKLKKKYVLAAIPVVILLYSSIAGMRAHQWRNVNSLYAFEVLHHPDSARTQLEFSNLLAHHGKFEDAIKATRAASALAPREPAYLIDILHLQSLSKRPLENSVNKKIKLLLAEEPISSFLTNQLGALADCISSECKEIDDYYFEWLNILIKRKYNSGDTAYFHYLLGRHQILHKQWDNAVFNLKKSHELDPKFIHPLFPLATIYINARYYDQARHTIKIIKRTNKLRNYSWHKEIRKLEMDLDRLSNPKNLSR